MRPTNGKYISKDVDSAWLERIGASIEKEWLNVKMEEAALAKFADTTQWTFNFVANIIHM